MQVCASVEQKRAAQKSLKSRNFKGCRMSLIVRALRHLNAKGTLPPVTPIGERAKPITKTNRNVGEESIGRTLQTFVVDRPMLLDYGRKSKKGFPMDGARAAALDYDGTRYTRVAIRLHWTIAALILFNLPVGFVHDYFGSGLKPIMMTLHKSFGFTVLMLTLVRIGWRLRHPVPAFDSAMAGWEIALARTIQWAFYALMLLIPASGWLVSSASGVRVTNFYWLVKIPPLPVSGHEAHELWESVHTTLGIAMSVLIVLHVAGALKHHFDGHPQILRRMLGRRDGSVTAP
jgi:cytochrome b561